MAERADPIGIWTRIAEDDGRPTEFFVQQWNSQLNVNAYAFNDIIAGEGLEGGGALADGEVTLSLPDVGTADTYGSATQVPVITTDEKGRVTNVTLATVTATVAVEDDDAVFGNFSIFNFVGTEWTLTDAGGGQIDIEVAAGSTGVDVEDEGVSITTGSTTLNFTGGVAVTDAGGGQTNIDIFAGPDVEDEGVALGTADTFDFVGAGVTATFSAGTVTVTIPGGGGSLEVEDDGVSVETGVDTINFTGAGVTVTNPAAGQVDVAISGGGGSGGGSGGGGGTYFHPLSPPTTTDFSTAVTDGTGAGSATDNTTRGLDVVATGAASDDWSGQFKAFSLPVSGTVEYICRILYTTGDGGSPGGGICLRNSSNGRKIMLGYDNNIVDSDFAVQQWTGATFGSTLVSYGAESHDAWFKIEADSTGDLRFYWSATGVTWDLMTSTTAATFLTAAGGSIDQIGFMAKYHTQTSNITIPFYSEDGSIGGDLEPGQSFFSGLSGKFETSASSTNVSMQGVCFTPDVDMTITHVLAYIDPGDTLDHSAAIIEMSDATTSATTVGTGNFSDAQTFATNYLGWARFEFSTPVELTAGTTYYVAARKNDNGTIVSAIASGDPDTWMNAPGRTEDFWARMTEANPANGTSFSSSNGGWGGIALEGYYESGQLLSSGGGGGGGIAGVDVEDDGVATVTGADTLDFTGDGVTVTDAGGGKATINIPGGGGSGGGAGNTDPSLFSPPTLNEFSTAVTGTITATATDSATRGMMLNATGGTNNHWLLRLKDWTPATETHIFRAKRSGIDDAGAFMGGGFVIRDSSSSRFLSLNFGPDSSKGNYRLTVLRWASETSFNATILNTGHPGQEMWGKVETTATSATFFVSADGENWVELATENFSTYVTSPDQIGFGIQWEDDPNAISFPFYSDDGSNSVTNGVPFQGVRRFSGWSGGDPLLINTSTANGDVSGSTFEVTANVTVEALNIQLRVDGSETNTGIIYEMSDNTTTGTIVAIVGETEAADTTSNVLGVQRLPFSVPIQLEPGKVYFCGLKNEDSTVNLALASASSNDPFPLMDGPVKHLFRWGRFTTTPAVSDSYDSDGTGYHQFALDGYYADDVDSGGGTSLYPRFTIPSASEFTKAQTANFSTTTSTLNDVTDPQCLELVATNLNDNSDGMIRAALNALDGTETTWRWEIAAIFNFASWARQEGGLYLKEGTAPVYTVRWAWDGGNSHDFRFSEWSNDGQTFNTANPTGQTDIAGDAEDHNYKNGLLYMALEFDGTDYFIQASKDGRNWWTIIYLNEASSSIVTQIDEIGFYLNPHNDNPAQVPDTDTCSISLFHHSFTST